MSVRAFCLECGEALDGPLDSGEVRPCPKCGSTSRHIVAVDSATLSIYESSELKGREPGRKRPFLEQRQGASFFRKAQRWVQHFRRIDRRNNRYDEVVADSDGTLIHECHEPLTEHTDHGDASKRTPNQRLERARQARPKVRKPVLAPLSRSPLAGIGGTSMPAAPRVTDPDTPTTSFLVPFLASVFHGLRFLSLHWLLARIRWLRNLNQAGFVEGWAVFHTVLALVLALVAHGGLYPGVVAGFLIYAGLRVLELVVYLVNVLIFDEWREKRAGCPYAVVGYRRLLLLLLLNYAELVLWFGAALLAFHQLSWLSLHDPSLAGAFRTALVAMVSLSLDGVQPMNGCARTLLAFQPLVGAFLTLLTLARFVSLMPLPASKDPAEGPGRFGRHYGKNKSG